MKKSPAKQDRPVEVFEKKKTEIKEPKKPKAHYTHRKEELLNQGFTQEDADHMIKNKATTGQYPAYKMKGHTLPGIKQKKSPTKWVQAVAALAPVVMDMVGKMGKKKEE